LIYSLVIAPDVDSAAASAADACVSCMLGSTSLILLYSISLHLLSNSTELSHSPSYPLSLEQGMSALVEQQQQDVSVQGYALCRISETCCFWIMAA